MRKREPCSVDIWFRKVVEIPQDSRLKLTSLTFFVHIHKHSINKRSKPKIR